MASSRGFLTELVMLAFDVMDHAAANILGVNHVLASWRHDG
jgi:hypothetical protein